MATKKIVAEEKREEGWKEGRRGSSRSLLKGALIERQEKNESIRAVRPSGFAYTCTLTLAMNKTNTEHQIIIEQLEDIFTFSVMDKFSR